MFECFVIVLKKDGKTMKQYSQRPNYGTVPEGLVCGQCLKSNNFWGISDISERLKSALVIGQMGHNVRF